MHQSYPERQPCIPTLKEGAFRPSKGKNLQIRPYIDVKSLAVKAEVVTFHGFRCLLVVGPYNIACATLALTNPFLKLYFMAKGMGIKFLWDGVVTGPQIAQEISSLIETISREDTERPNWGNVYPLFDLIKNDHWMPHKQSELSSHRIRLIRLH